jgi:hypothetical protein
MAARCICSTKAEQSVSFEKRTPFLWPWINCFGGAQRRIARKVDLNAAKKRRPSSGEDWERQVRGGMPGFPGIVQTRQGKNRSRAVLGRASIDPARALVAGASFLPSQPPHLDSFRSLYCCVWSIAP